MLDLGLLMYGGLLVLWVWRCIFYYRVCGLWLSFLNYTSLLYVILSASLVYCTVEFYKHTGDALITSENKDADIWSIGWLRPVVLGSPAAVCLTVILCWFQTEGHVFEIHKDCGMKKHDRAVQIIALPSVFAVMALASMVPIYELVTGTISTEMMTIPFGVDLRNRFAHLQVDSDALWQGEPADDGGAGDFHHHHQGGQHHHEGAANGGSSWDVAMRYALWRYETCFYVGDLFEAWALYQFGLLALELIWESFKRKEASDQEAERVAARELLAAHGAVSSLAWLGTMAFVLVCLGQTACAMYPYLVGSMEQQSNIDGVLLGFQVAGFIASGVAIYNVFTVERSFHNHLENSSPLLKFLSVKILVSLSFFQRGILVILQQGNKLMPGFIRHIVAYVPFIGDILIMTEVQLHLFYPALILYECFLTTLMHSWAWPAAERWYTEAVPCDDPERQPLLPSKDGGGT